MIALCIICAVLCMLYYILVVIYAGAGSTFVWFWLLATFGFAGLAVMFALNRRMHFLSKIPKGISITVGIVVLSGVLLFTFLFGCVISGMMSKPEKQADYVIVLGAQIRGEYVTKSLAKRLNAALEYYQTNQDVMIIVSGGQGEGENVSEAYAMKNYLIERGVPAESIIMEDKSSTTNENLRFSYEIICGRDDADKNVLVCSNSFHIFRATKLAEHIGVKNVEGLAAESDLCLLPNYMVRDSLAIFKEFLLGNIDI